MSLHEEFRKNKLYTKERILNFIKKIITEIDENEMTSLEDFPHLTLLTVDPISLCIEGVNFGNIEIVTSNNYFYGTPVELLKLKVYIPSLGEVFSLMKLLYVPTNIKLLLFIVINILLLKIL